MSLSIDTLIVKWTAKVKVWRNSFPVPRLLSFFIRKDGKPNPTIEEALAEAPDPSQNWARSGLGWQVFGPIKVWHIIALPIVMWVFKVGSGALQFFIEWSTQLIMLIPLAIIGYFIWKSFKK